MLTLFPSSELKKRFKLLPKKLQRRAVERLELFVSDPHNRILRNHQLHGEYAECRSIDVNGDLRIIYKKLDENTYLLLAIGTRASLYE